MSSEVITEDGEVIEEQPSTALVPIAAKANPYEGAGMLVVLPEESKQLSEVLPDEEHDILPTGEVYVSQVHYRRLLNRVFGHGQWALVPRSNWFRERNTICGQFAMIVRGKFIAEAIGEQEYYPDNDRQSYATACESAKSNALTRCCKDLGIASECWDKRWTQRFINEHCVKVWCRKKNGENYVSWRRRDAEPFWNETGYVEKKPLAPAKSAESAKKPEPQANGNRLQFWCDKITWLRNQNEFDVADTFNGQLALIKKEPEMLKALKKSLWDASKHRGLKFDKATESFFFPQEQPA